MALHVSPDSALSGLVALCSIIFRSVLFRLVFLFVGGAHFVPLPFFKNGSPTFSRALLSLCSRLVLVCVPLCLACLAVCVLSSSPLGISGAPLLSASAVVAPEFVAGVPVLWCCVDVSAYTVSPFQCAAYPSLALWILVGPRVGLCYLL